MKGKAHEAPPRHLSADSKSFWRRIVAEYDLEEHHRRVLTAACEAWDRMNAAGAAIRSGGLIVTDRFAQERAHPAVAIERDSRIAFIRALRELDLEGESLPDPRPPRRS